ncbi:MAG: hypothetical protein JXA30_14820 [Deltaproteobacteria bacterium]|nr:hypothetical protein [Deltaproteobacteria bacterium]
MRISRERFNSNELDKSIQRRITAFYNVERNECQPRSGALLDDNLKPITFSPLL